MVKSFEQSYWILISSPKNESVMYPRVTVIHQLPTLSLIAYNYHPLLEGLQSKTAPILRFDRHMFGYVQNAEKSKTQTRILWLFPSVSLSLSPSNRSLMHSRLLRDFKVIGCILSQKLLPKFLNPEVSLLIHTLEKYVFFRVLDRKIVYTSRPYFHNLWKLWKICLRDLFVSHSNSLSLKVNWNSKGLNPGDHPNFLHFHPAFSYYPKSKNLQKVGGAWPLLRRRHLLLGAMWAHNSSARVTTCDPVWTLAVLITTLSTPSIYIATLQSLHFYSLLFLEDSEFVDQFSWHPWLFWLFQEAYSPSRLAYKLVINRQDNFAEWCVSSWKTGKWQGKGDENKKRSPKQFTLWTPKFRYFAAFIKFSRKSSSFVQLFF